MNDFCQRNWFILFPAFSVPSYGNRKNAYEEVSQYFRAHFIQAHRKHDTAERVLFTVCLSTSLIFIQEFNFQFNPSISPPCWYGGVRCQMLRSCNWMNWLSQDMKATHAVIADGIVRFLLSSFLFSPTHHLVGDSITRKHMSGLGLT
jgi:hypothetical protein